MATLGGDRRLDNILTSDIDGMKNDRRRERRDRPEAAAKSCSARRRARRRHGSRHPHRATADGLIDQKYSPAHRVAKHRRPPTTCLLEHAAARGADLPTDALLLFRNGHR
jgi:hypothetical protein